MGEILRQIVTNSQTAPYFQEKQLSRQLADLALDLNKLASTGSAEELGQATSAVISFAQRHPDSVKNRIDWFLLDIYEVLDQQISDAAQAAQGPDQVLVALAKLWQWGETAPNECQHQIAWEKLELQREYLARCAPEEKAHWQEKTRDSEAYLGAMRREEDQKRQKEREKAKDLEYRQRQSRPRRP